MKHPLPYVLALILSLPALLPGVTTAADVAGRWQSDFGVLTLRQDGTRIQGTYSCCQGTLEGTLADESLDLEWRDPISGEGWVRFEITKAGRELRGTWGVRGEALSRGRWNATRLSEPQQPRGEPSYWQIDGRSREAGILSGTAVLYHDGQRIQGELEGVYHLRVEGQSMRIEVFNRLAGTATESRLDLEWHNPLDGSAGTMTLRRTRDALTGTWRTHGGQSSGEITFSKSARRGAESEREPRLEDTLERREGFQQGSQHLDRAEALRSQERYQDAVREYQQAIALIPGDLHPNRLAAAYYGMGDSYRELGREAEAKRSFEAVLDLGDEVDEALRAVAELALY